MTDPTQNVTLAMPVGLPPPGTAPATHFAALQSRLSANLSNTTAKVWIADDPVYSGLFAMSKGFLRMIPAGGTAPDGTTLTVPMLVLKPWLWDYLALRRNVPGGGPMPHVIGYGNVDVSTVQLAIRAELATNARYQSLSAANRTQAETDFIAGTNKLLMNGATMIGRALTDASAQAPAQPGWRRLDLLFFDENGTPVDPSLFFNLWGLIGGMWITGHPLLTKFTRAVTPAVAPIEGGTRIRVQGTGFVAGTSVDVDGQPATDVAVSSDGNTLWATLPAHAAASTDVVVTVPGQTMVTFASAVGYSEDVATTARAVITSLAVRLAEIRDRATALQNAGALDTETKADFSLTLEMDRRQAPALIEERARARGVSAVSPDVMSTWEDMLPSLRTLSDAVLPLIS